MLGSAAASQTTFALQWQTDFGNYTFIYPGQAPFRVGDVVGFAAVSIYSMSGTADYSVCEFFNIMESSPTWCLHLGSNYHAPPIVLGGGDNSVFAAITNATFGENFQVLRWVADPVQSQPALQFSGNQSLGCLALSGNGDVLAVVEPLANGASSVSLYSATAPAYAAGEVALPGLLSPGTASFGSSAPTMFIASYMDYAIVNTFSVSTDAAGKLPGPVLGSCNAQTVLLETDSGSAIYTYVAKTKSWMSLLVSPGMGALSNGCTTAAFFSSGTTMQVFNLSRTAAVLAGSVPASDVANLWVSDTGAVVVWAVGALDLVAWPSPYVGEPLRLTVGDAGSSIDVDHVLVFEPPSPNGVLAYVVGTTLSYTSNIAIMFLAVVNGTEPYSA